MPGSRSSRSDSGDPRRQLLEPWPDLITERCDPEQHDDGYAGNQEPVLDNVLSSLVSYESDQHAHAGTTVALTRRRMIPAAAATTHDVPHLAHTISALRAIPSILLNGLYVGHGTLKAIDMSRRPISGISV